VKTVSRPQKCKAISRSRDAINGADGSTGVLILKSPCTGQSPYHIQPNCRQSELRSLLFRKIENALAKPLKYAAVVCETLHRTNSYHRPLNAKLAAYRAQAQKSDNVGIHH
jgi:hypothetical protein